MSNPENQSRLASVSLGFLGLGRKAASVGGLVSIPEIHFQLFVRYLSDVPLIFDLVARNLSKQA
jgi:hypothetical protein